LTFFLQVEYEKVVPRSRLMKYCATKYHLLLIAVLVVSFVRLTIAGQDELTANSIQRKTNSIQVDSSYLRSRIAAAIAPELPSATPTWTAAAASPVAIARYAFAQVGQDLYVISGEANAGPDTSVNRYNATTNIWTARTPIPVGSEAPAATYSAYNNKIYVADGFSGSTLRIYDIATNSWTAGPARPGFAHSYGAAAGSYQDKVYIVGGSNNPTPTLSIYNITSNSWTTGPDAPASYQLGGYTQVGRFLYLIGSFTGNSANSTVSMRLDMSTSTWTTGPVWTPQRNDFALAASGSKLFAIGGDATGGGFFDASVQVDELDTGSWPSGSWSSSPANLPSARQSNQAGFFSTGRVGGEIWSTGGVTAAITFLADHLFRPNVLQLASAVSRKSHNGTFFAIDLPLAGEPGVECRSGAAGHTLVFTFTRNVVSGNATVTTGTGTAGAASFSGNTMTVPLTGVTDQQKITVTLNNVTDVSSQVLPATAVSMNVLLGDTTANKSVNSSDIAQTKSQSGAPISATNFRTDTNVNGAINASDVAQVKANSGHGLP
jgi:hypothetical protein